MTTPWLTEAKKHAGLAEIPGPKHNIKVVGWLKQLGAWWTDDETPWCGVFVAHCMRWAGKPLPKAWYRAKAWADWGQKLEAPAVGCVVVFERKGGGHVAFVVGEDSLGRLVCLGGNQGNRVSYASFEKERAVAYRWPMGSMPTSYELAVVNSSGRSISEA